MGKNFEDLNVWKEAMDLAEAVYRATDTFPKTEQYGLTSQLRRSVVSIASNIAEGSARATNGEFMQFLGIARGSAAEAKTQLMLSQRLNLLDEVTAHRLIEHTDRIARMLNGLRNSITNNQQLATSN
ncbi:MAG: four helix bundle protein [Rickettsiales bacterium]|nr:four helix bundle protein [Rickettsiales bacterium]